MKIIKKIIHYFWRERFQVGKYFVIGFSGVFLDMGTLIFFKEVYGFSAVMSVVLNQIIMLTYIFSLNKYWTFRNKEIPYKQIVRFLILAGINYFFSVIIMYIFSQRLTFDYRIVRISTIAIMTLWNFFLYKYWVYI